MHYYPHHIGDYAAATAHLSWDEDQAYTRLLRMYYQNERPIPADVALVCRLLRCTRLCERRAVAAVLREFFELREDGWHQARCDAELAEFQARSERNRESGRRGGRSRARAAADAAMMEGADALPDVPAEVPPDAPPGNPAPNGLPGAGLADAKRALGERLANQNHNQNQNENQDQNENQSQSQNQSQNQNQKTAKRTSLLVPLPDGFGISDRVLRWARARGYGDLDLHLEHFLGYARRRAPRYADWDEALMCAVRQDWARLRGGSGGPAPPERGAHVPCPAGLAEIPV